MNSRPRLAKYPDVDFRRLAITNQYFNDTAKKQSSLLKVEWMERDGLLALLNQHPIQLQEFMLAVA